MTLELDSLAFARRAMRKGYMVVRDVVEEMDLVLLKHKASGDRVDRSITPALVEEPAILVERLKKVDIFLGPKPLEASNLKVGPLVSLTS